MTMVRGGVLTPPHRIRGESADPSANRGKTPLPQRWRCHVTFSV